MKLWCWNGTQRCMRIMGLAMPLAVAMLAVEICFWIIAGQYAEFSGHRALAQEPSLETTLNALNFRNLEEIDNPGGTFPAGTYEIELLAEWASFHDTNTVSIYQKDNFNPNCITPLIAGPAGGYGLLDGRDEQHKRVKETLLDLEEFGLCFFINPDPEQPELQRRYYTETAKNPGNRQHARIFIDLDRTDTFLIGFEDLSDNDFQDMVFKLRRVSTSTRDPFGGNRSLQGLELLAFLEIDGEEVTNRNLSLVVIANSTISENVFFPCPTLHIHGPNEKTQTGEWKKILNDGRIVKSDVKGGIYEHARSLRFEFPRANPVTIGKASQQRDVVRYIKALKDFEGTGVPSLETLTVAQIREIIGELGKTYSPLQIDFVTIDIPLGFDFQCPHGANTAWAGANDYRLGGVDDKLDPKLTSLPLSFSNNTFDQFLPSLSVRDANSSLNIPFMLHSPETDATVLADSPISAFIEVTFDCALVECPSIPNTAGTLGPPTIQWSTNPASGSENVFVIDELEKTGTLTLDLPPNLPDRTVVFFTVVIKEAVSQRILGEQIIRLVQDKEPPLITSFEITKTQDTNSDLVVNVTAQDQAASISFTDLLVSSDDGQSYSTFPAQWQEGDLLNPTRFQRHFKPAEGINTIFKVRVVDAAGNSAETLPFTVSDLSLKKIADVDPVNAGQNLTYNLSITNHGPSDATGVILSDTLPTTVTLVSVMPTQGACVEANHTVSCELQTLTNGQSADVTLIVKPTIPGRLVNRSTVKSNAIDPLLDNNGSASVTTIIPPVLYLSFSSSSTIGGVSFDDSDILAYDTVSDTWQMAFDGSNVGITTNLDAFVWQSGTLLLSFQENTNIPGLGEVDDADIVRFTPTALGNQTSGTFEWFLHGSDVELTTEGEDIDAIDFTPDGTLIISTKGDVKTSTIAASDEDLLVFSDNSLGVNKSGAWAIYLDGSELKMPPIGEDIWGVWVDKFSDKIFLSTNEAEIFVCDAKALNERDQCNLRLFWNGADYGIESKQIDGLDINTYPPDRTVNNSDSTSVSDNNQNNQTHQVLLPLVMR